MCLKYFLILLLFTGAIPTFYASEDPLQQYIREGLENNLALKLKQDDYQLSLQVLAEAKGLFLPDISLNARYTVAGGGRVIEFPVGDMLNPVYSTLNQLTSSQLFPPLENQEFPFVRPTEHETKLRIVQPILNTGTGYNKRIRESLAASGKADMDAYRRELVADIKLAWYNHAKAVEVKKVLEGALTLVEEVIRVNERLLAADKITLDVLSRSRADLQKVHTEISEAKKNIANSAAYFNFLLNRPLDSPIRLAEPGDIALLPDEEEINEVARREREELQSLQGYTQAAQYTLELQRSKSLPKVVAVMDYGIQGTRYRFTGEDDFYMASLVLRWGLFHGRTQHARTAQAKIGLEKIQKQEELLEQTIALQVRIAYNDLVAARDKIELARKTQIAAAETFRLVERKYSNGQASILELIDARETITGSETGLTIAKYELLERYVDLERVAALHVFDE